MTIIIRYQNNKIKKLINKNPEINQIKRIHFIKNLNFNRNINNKIMIRKIHKRFKPDILRRKFNIYRKSR